MWRRAEPRINPQDEAARADWQQRTATMPARRVVVVDESSTHVEMAPRYARAERGQRAYDKQRRNYGKNLSLLSGLRLAGMTAPMVIEGALTTEVFAAYVRQVLLATLHLGDIVIVDNLICHKSTTVRRLLLAHGCQLLFLPTYSPDLSPIDNAFAKLKQCLRAVPAQTLDALIEAIAAALPTLSP